MTAHIPGDYDCICCECGMVFHGDKRCVVCAMCDLKGQLTHCKAQLAKAHRAIARAYTVLTSLSNTTKAALILKNVIEDSTK